MQTHTSSLVPWNSLPSVKQLKITSGQSHWWALTLDIQTILPQQDSRPLPPLDVLSLIRKSIDLICFMSCPHSDNIHSGTAYSYLPKSLLAEIFKSVSGARLLSDGVTTSYPCKSIFGLSYVFANGTTDYGINLRDLVLQRSADGVTCTSTLLVGGGPDVLLGDTFCESPCRAAKTRDSLG
jgi:hypothetical protein